MYIKGDLDSNQKIIGNGLVLNIDAAQYRSFPRGGDIVTNGLVLNLDAGNASSYSGTGTTWYDISGNQINGTLTNGPTYNSDNQGSIVFDGTNDYVIGSPSISNVNEYTFEVWANVTVTSAGGSPISTNGTGSQGSTAFIQMGGGPNPWQFNTITTDVPLTGVWYHVVGTQTMTTQTIYINGVLKASGSGTSSLGTQYTVGTRYDRAAQSVYFNGKIAAARIYNRALSAAEVTQNYDALKYRYGVIGSTWFDLSGNANNGTLTNGPTLNLNNGGSIVFDGTNDYVLDSTINYNSYNNNFTAIAWVKINTFNAAGGIIGWGHGGIAPYYTWVISLSNNTFIIQIYNGTSYSITTGVVETNKWYYIAFVVYQSGLMELYLNNTKYSTVGSANLIKSRGDQYDRTIIGVNANTGVPSAYLNGNIALTQIYNRALSTTEVLNNFNAVKSRFGYPNTSIVTDGLVLNLNAGNTNSYPTTGTTWYDLAGTNNGTLINGPTFNSANGGSIVFDGTNDYVSLGTFTNLGITNRTYSFWYYTNTLPSGTARIITFPANDTSTDTPAFTFSLDNRSIFSGGLGGSPYDGQVDVISYSLNTWVNITATITNKTISFYINGNFIKSATSTGTVPTSPIGYIGRYNSFYGQYGVGRVANLQIYNRALSETEIKQNFDATKSTFGL